MATLVQIKYIRSLRKDGVYPKTIAKFIGLPVEDVRKALEPRRKKNPKRKLLRPETVNKIREEYNIMLENGYKKKYIREELSKWHGIKPSTIQRIVTGAIYKDV